MGERFVGNDDHLFAPRACGTYTSRMLHHDRAKHRFVLSLALVGLSGCARGLDRQDPVVSVAARGLAEARAFSEDGKALIQDPEAMVTSPTAGQPTVSTTLPDSASGTRMLEVGNMTPVRIEVRLLDARDDSKRQNLEGYAVYPGALQNAPDSTLIARSTRLGVEDYVYFPTRPSREALTYEVKLGGYVAGLRVVAHQLEFLTRDGLPGLRVSAPYAVTQAGTRVLASLAVEGCNYDNSPLPFRAPDLQEGTGSNVCKVHVSWEGAGASYPLVLDPEWTSPSQLPSGFQYWAPQVYKLASGRVLATGNNTNASQLWDPVTGLWSATGATGEVCNPNEGRAVLLSDGKVLAFSGVNSFGTQLGDVKSYDPATGAWTSRANIPVGLNRPQGVTLNNGKVLVSGGILSGGSVTNAARLYDPVANTWTTTGSMTTARRDHSMASASANRVVAVGGGTSGSGCANGTTSSEVYNTSSGNWSAAGATTTAFYNPDILALSTGRVLIAGSMCNTSSTNLFQPGPNTWSNSGNVNSGVTNFAGRGLGEIGGVVYLAGNEGGYPFGFQYNIASSTWSNLSAQYTQPYPQEGAGVALNDGRFFFVDRNGQTRTYSACGDSVLSPGEACDDGNATSGDGCSSSCAVESGYSCNRVNVLPNGSFESPVQSGGYTTYSTGQTFGGWLVTTGDVEHDGGGHGAAIPNGTQTVDLNGSTTGGISQSFATISGHTYAWDMRISGNNGCGQNTFNGTVVFTSGSTTTHNFSTNTLISASSWDHEYGKFVAGAASTSLAITSTIPSCGGPFIDDIRVVDMSVASCTFLCGNAVVDGGETCDDGNLISGDGCSATCGIEAGASCFPTSMLVNGDVEQPKVPNGSWNSYPSGANVGGWTVGGAGGIDVENRAQGFVQPTGEQDIDLSGGSAGSITQTVTTVVGRSYSWSMRLAANFGCGGASKAGYVQAVSGGTNTWNFLTTTNATAATWDLVTGTFIAGAPSTVFSVVSTDTSCGGPVIDAIRLLDSTEQACQTACGNAVIGSGETCDDGNKISGDGCSSTCAIEAGNSCSAPANVVLNGSFESPAQGSGGLTNYTGTSIPSWTIASGSDIEVWNAALNSVAASGSNFLDISGSTVGMMTQTGIPAVNGTNYVWSARGASWPNSPAYRTAALGVVGNAGYRVQIVGTSVSSGTSAYDTFQGRFTAGASTSFDIQALKDSSTGMHVDDVQIKAVQSCTCDGNAGSGTPRACSAVAPICNATGGCVVDTHAGCS